MQPVKETEPFPPGERTEPVLELLDGQPGDPFQANIDHLEALEYCSRLRLGIALLARRTRLQMGFSGGEEPPESGMRMGQSLFLRQNLSFPVPPDEELHVETLRGLLDRVECDMASRTRNTRGPGVPLLFDSFCDSYHLDGFERKVLALLLANSTAKAFRDFYGKSGIDPHDRGDGGMSVGAILCILHHEYKDQIRSMRYFSASATLIKNEIVIPCSHYDNTTTILDVSVYLHERIVRHVLGDNSVYGLGLQCVSRGRQGVRLEQVVLPGTLKEDVVNMARSYLNSRARKSMTSLSDFFGYGSGLAFLFHGASGTGKTMLAHALANSLDCELISAHLEASLTLGVSSEEIIKYVFKEAKLCNGIVFFDECDKVFRAGYSDARTLLIELEKSDCITILATNRSCDLEPAMDRRITMKVHFPIPDRKGRERIWKALTPPAVSVAKEVDFAALAAKHPFSGSQIKNVMLMALNRAMSKCTGSEVTLGFTDIEEAAAYQKGTIFDLDYLSDTYSSDVSIDGLPLRLSDRKMLKRLAAQCREAGGRRVGMRIIVGCSDLRTGLRAVEGIARECDLKIKRFPFSDMLGNTNSEKMRQDPCSRKSSGPLEHALRIAPCFGHLILLADYDSVFESCFLGTDNGFRPKGRSHGTSLTLSEMEGLLFVVTEPLRSTSVPAEFDCYVEIHPPPEEVQIRQWEGHFGDTRNGKKFDSELVSLVEQYPLHLMEIDQISRRALIRRILKNGTKSLAVDSILDELRRRQNPRKPGLLFGDWKAGARVDAGS